MQQIFNTTGIELLQLQQFLNHLSENSITTSQHSEQIKIAIGFIHEHIVNVRIAAQLFHFTNENAFPLAIAVPDAPDQFRKMIAVNSELLKNTVY